MALKPTNLLQKKKKQQFSSLYVDLFLCCEFFTPQKKKKKKTGKLWKVFYVLRGYLNAFVVQKNDNKLINLVTLHLQKGGKTHFPCCT